VLTIVQLDFTDIGVSARFQFVVDLTQIEPGSGLGVGGGCLTCAGWCRYALRVRSPKGHGGSAKGQNGIKFLFTVHDLSFFGRLEKQRPLLLTVTPLLALSDEPR